MNLPMPQYGKTDKETIGILMDTVVKLRKELEYVLCHLDEQNIPMMKSVVGDIKGAYTAIEQNEQQISLLAVDLTGAKSQIAIQAGQISSLVSTTQGQQSQITQNANSITSLVTTTQGQQTQITQNANSINLLSTTVSGHTAQINIQADQISSKVGYNGVISAINQTAEQISIDASRINLNGITTMSGLTYVNKTLRVGLSGQGANELAFGNGQGIDAASDGSMIIRGNSFSNPIMFSGTPYLTVNGDRLATWDDVSGMIGNYVYAGGGQNLRIQIYNGNLEVYKDGSYYGTIGFS